MTVPFTLFPDSPYTGCRVSLRPGEVVARGATVVVEFADELPATALRGITVAGRRVPVVLAKDRRSVTVDTSALPVGSHELRLTDDWAARAGLPPTRTVPFVVIETRAQIPSELAVHHAARIRLDEAGIARLPLAGKRSGAYVEVFKAEHRESGAPVELAFDAEGQEIDLTARLAELAKARSERFGKVHPTLHAAVAKAKADKPLPVAVWLVAPEADRDSKPEFGELSCRPAQQEAALATWKELAGSFADSCAVEDLRVERIDEAAPVVYGLAPARAVAELAARPEVAAVFLHEPAGRVDLTDSIAVANADDAHAAGVTGRGVNVAVYEDGPDDTSNLAIAGRFSTVPGSSDHSRHTHGIIKNVQPNAPHGHAPDCNLFSANSYDLGAISWAAQDRGCTVISQSFHRDSEETSSGQSFDDLYKDNLALHWPYPTICEAAGNGADNEFVNHKGYNRLVVANHDDAATGMAWDTVFRNPASTHGDRELPEISANGTDVTTVGLTKWGTSMAAPAVAGGAALIQQKDGTLKSWPEGCRAILLASASRNPDGGTWWSDVLAGRDGVDGTGALDSGEAVRVAGQRATRNGPAMRRGWDVGTVRSSEVGRDGFVTHTYRVTAPSKIFSPRVKVALAWDSKVTNVDLFGFQIPISSVLTVDLDLQVRDSTGAVVASSASWDNSYEIAEFAARRGATYDIRIRRWSGTDGVWFGLAWTVTGFDLFEQVGELMGGLLAQR